MAPSFSRRPATLSRASSTLGRKGYHTLSSSTQRAVTTTLPPTIPSGARSPTPRRTITQSRTMVSGYRGQTARPAIGSRTDAGALAPAHNKEALVDLCCTTGAQADRVKSFPSTWVRLGEGGGSGGGRGKGSGGGAPWRPCVDDASEISPNEWRVCVLQSVFHLFGVNSTEWPPAVQPLNSTIRCTSLVGGGEGGTLVLSILLDEWLVLLLE